jgi:protein phosphatase 1G
MGSYHCIEVDFLFQAGKDSGCTAIVSLLVKNKLYVANAGDSRCVISMNGKANDLSKDHKPTDEAELKRILAAGGRVSSDGRINHGLNLSRSFGDNLYSR